MIGKDGSGHWFKKNALQNFREFPEVQRYLEVGVWRGRSLFWVLKNLKPQEAWGIDPYDDDTKRPPGTNIKLADEIDKRWSVEFPDVHGCLFREPSSVVLPRMLGEWWLAFDLVYIDGSHHGLDVLRDAAIASQLVRTGGLLVFDDWEARIQCNIAGLRLAVDTFQRLASDEFEVLKVNKQVVMRRVRDGRVTRACDVRESIL